MVFAFLDFIFGFKATLTLIQHHSRIVMNNKLILMGIIVVTAISIAIGNSLLNIPSAKAIGGGTCDVCAKDFAPGQLSKDIGLPAKDFAPGYEAKLAPAPCSACNGASDFAPGQLKKQPATTTFG
jgi:hypothetical protein